MPLSSPEANLDTKTPTSCIAQLLWAIVHLCSKCFIPRDLHNVFSWIQTRLWGEFWTSCRKIQWARTMKGLSSLRQPLNHLFATNLLALVTCVSSTCEWEQLIHIRYQRRSILPKLLSWRREVFQNRPPIHLVVACTYFVHVYGLAISSKFSWGHFSISFLRFEWYGFV